MDPRLWIALNSLNSVGNVLFKRLILRFGSAGAVFAAQAHEMLRVEGVRPPAVKAVKEFSDWGRVDEELGRARDFGAEVITLSDPRYPANLREIHDPPPYLYVKGGLIPGDKVSVAIVGSRMASQLGRQITAKFAGELAAKGITIVSGGARGIDTESHKGALSAGGRTIVVLGCGIDIAYPSENRSLFGQAAEKGAVVSEYPMGAQPLPGNFPARNRIISGIALGTLVVEAAEDSGSLITANCSVEQGREVYAVPGSVASQTSKGTNSLIKRGAKLVQGPQDILEDLFPYMKGYMKDLALGDEGGREPEAPKIKLEPEEQKLYDIITIEPVHVDDLAEKSGVAVSKALSLLLGLELKGIVRQVPGMRYVRAL